MVVDREGLRIGAPRTERLKPASDISNGSEVAAREELSVSELYEACLQNENKWTKLDLDQLKILFFKSSLSLQPLFPPPPAPDEFIGATVKEKEREQKISMGLYDGTKYRMLIELLKAASDRDSKLLVFARWLAHEKVCEPEDIIGTEEIRRRSKEMFRGLSAADFHNADLVRAWIPYFRRLLQDWRIAKSTANLRKKGYAESAIQCAQKKHSPVAAACQWLSDNRPSLNTTSAALANAYSRVYGSKRPQTSRPAEPTPRTV